MVGDPLPSLPTFSSLDDDGPDTSSPAVVATTTDRLLLFADSDNSSNWAWVADTPGVTNPLGPAVLADYWGGSSQPQYTLTLRHFWQKVDGSYTRVNPGATFTQSVTQTSGISTTDESSLAAELSVGTDGLSAKITATFSHSVTVSQETSITKTYTVGAPDPGLVRAWALYQLMDEIVALDASGNVIPVDAGHGDVSWVPQLPFADTSGAFLHYFGTPDQRGGDRPTVRQVLPSGVFTPVQKDFPAP